ncbi:hypothetical protein FOYG_06600 [Fusarium oxysporum NRRL 32931]|uniref:Uncharacterized protein n=2 Tax=Fusarium oxysporum TaxID=5507 RepID=W9IJ81_FUSOX|nr:hypothetical protein FOYG_06600 [Fusarium oxysporum NRRL 32931]EXA52458.1 hypothetical protein FOVG_00732 [Fusarium oxysporum f. sp. pisi HDV247]
MVTLLAVNLENIALRAWKPAWPGTSRCILSLPFRQTQTWLVSVHSSRDCSKTSRVGSSQYLPSTLLNKVGLCVSLTFLSLTCFLVFLIDGISLSAVATISKSLT